MQAASCKYTAASCYANITGAIDESRSLRASRRREIERRVLVFSFQAASARFQLSVRYCLCVSKTRILVAGGPGRRRVTTRFSGEAEPGVPAPSDERRDPGGIVRTCVRNPVRSGTEHRTESHPHRAQSHAGKNAVGPERIQRVLVSPGHQDLVNPCDLSIPSPDSFRESCLHGSWATAVQDCAELYGRRSYRTSSNFHPCLQKTAPLFNELTSGLPKTIIHTNTEHFAITAEGRRCV